MIRKVKRILRFAKGEFFSAPKSSDEIEFQRLRNHPRYTNTESSLFGKKITIPDAASFVFTYDELFNKEIYKFKTDNKRPYIIDCGANIGLSVIYFKQLFPCAEIIAFEPDDKIFDALQFNVESFQFSDVTLINKACWNEETTLKFYSEGADAGRTAVDTDVENIIEVNTVRLKEFLNRKVDFLKMDIEGAETKVLEDCAELLNNVNKLFVEYHSFRDQEQTIGKLLLIISNAGFRYQIQHVGVFSLQPFINIENYNNMDLQLNIFAFK